jgi:hypothetical protein
VPQRTGALQVKQIQWRLPVTSASSSHAPLLRALKCTVLYTRWYVVAHSEAVHARPAVMGTHVNRAKLAGRAAAMPSTHVDV